MGTIPEMADAGVRERTGLFVSPLSAAAVGRDYLLLGSGRADQVQLTARQRDALTVHGYRPRGATLRDAVFDMLTAGSDPVGEDRPRPLLPANRRSLALQLGQRHTRRFDLFRDAHGDRVRAVLRHEFGRVFDAAPAQDKTVPRKLLGYWCDRFHLSKTKTDQWRQLIPLRLRRDVPGPLPHETSISDDFNRADESLDAGSWSEVLNDWDVDTNVAKLTAAFVLGTARHTTALSGDDHDAQTDITHLPTSGNSSIRAGACGRFSGAANTAYFACGKAVSVDNLVIGKIVAGTVTELGTTAITYSLPDTVAMRISGSTLSGWWNGGNLTTTTDTAIASGNYAGLIAFGGGGADVNRARMDNFSAADLAPAMTGRCYHPSAVFSDRPFQGQGASLYVNAGTTVQYRRARVLPPVGGWPFPGPPIIHAGDTIDWSADTVAKTPRVDSTTGTENDAAQIVYELPAALKNTTIAMDVRHYRDDCEFEGTGDHHTLEVDASGDDVTELGGTAEMLTPEIRAGGVVRLRWRYTPPSDGSAVPARFRVDYTAGPTAPADQTTAYVSGQTLYELDTLALSDASAYTITLSCENSSSTQSRELITAYSFTADATGPDVTTVTKDLV